MVWYYEAFNIRWDQGLLYEDLYFKLDSRFNRECANRYITEPLLMA